MQQNNLNEISILSSIYHPNIISCKETFWDNKNKTLNIIMEYCDDGDLETKINTMKRNKIKFDENLIWIYTIQILFGLKALHDKGVIHRDLKSANIFLTKLNLKFKIGDLNTLKIKNILTKLILILIMVYIVNVFCIKQIKKIEAKMQILIKR